MPINDIGDGTTVAFGTSGFTAYVDAIRWSGQGREFIDMSHIGTTGGMPFKGSKMYDPGTIQLDIHHDMDQDIPPFLDDDLETITVTFPNGATFVASGAIQNYDWGSEKRDKISGTVTVKLSGTPAVTAAP